MAYDTINATVNGQNIRLLVPTTYDAGDGAPLIIYHHGVGESETALTSDALKTDCVNALTDAGYILAGSNAHGENWGNEASLTDYEDLYDYCITNYNILRVAAWSQSMGGMSGLLSVAAGAIPYTNWLGTYPVCNLRDMYDNGYDEAIEAAYGIAGDGSDYDEKTAGHDPVLLSGAAFDGVRMRFYASTSDTVVDRAENTDAMYALLGGFAQRSLVACSGDHGDSSHFVPAEYVTFFNQGEYQMTSKWPPVKNSAFTFRCTLFGQSDNQIKSNPTIAAGDWKVSTDGGTFTNLATLPDVDPDSSVQVLVSLSADEMNGDEVVVTAIDASGAEWHSMSWSIHTVGQTFDTMDANIDSILADTAEIGAAGAGLTALASQASVNDLPTNAEFTSALADLPTNAELAAAIAAGDDPVLAAIAALNNLSAAEVVAAMAAAVVDGTITRAQFERILLAFVAGETTGAGTSTPAFLGQDGETERITATMVNGNRTNVILDGD